jgi:tRNA(Ile)-lysidine synthase
VCRVEVAGRAGGPEASAREARYAALVEAARSAGAATVLLGHTRDDQAETVLLALVRGGGARGLAAMPARRVEKGVTLLRPLLDVDRSQTEAACVSLGLRPWRDPHNADPAFARTQARALLAELVTRLGSGVVANLARTAELAAADAEVIDGLAEAALPEALDAAGGIGVAALRGQPTAVRRAMLRLWLRRSGVPGAGLGHGHLTAVDGLVTGWRGQRGVSLPGGFVAGRREGALELTSADPRRHE